MSPDYPAHIMDDSSGRSLLEPTHDHSIVPHALDQPVDRIKDLAVALLVIRHRLAFVGQDIGPCFQAIMLAPHQVLHFGEGDADGHAMPLRSKERIASRPSEKPPMPEKRSR